MGARQNSLVTSFSSPRKQQLASNVRFYRALEAIVVLRHLSFMKVTWLKSQTLFYYFCCSFWSILSTSRIIWMRFSRGSVLNFHFLTSRSTSLINFCTPGMAACSSSMLFFNYETSLLSRLNSSWISFSRCITSLLSFDRWLIVGFLCTFHRCTYQNCP